MRNLIVMPETNDSLPLVELWDLKLSLTLIVRRPTGVVFTNQVGGIACLHPRIEGVLIPLHTHPMAPDDPLENYYESSLFPEESLPSTRCTRIREWLQWADLLDVFEPVGDIELAEAWIPVRILQEPHEGYIPMLGAFRGQTGILTYENSD